jgi:hypothetical protein
MGLVAGRNRNRHFAFGILGCGERRGVVDLGTRQGKCGSRAGHSGFGAAGGQWFCCGVVMTVLPPKRAVGHANFARGLYDLRLAL